MSARLPVPVMLVVKVRAPRPPTPWGITTQSLDRELARRILRDAALTEHRDGQARSDAGGTISSPRA